MKRAWVWALFGLSLLGCKLLPRGHPPAPPPPPPPLSYVVAVYDQRPTMEPSVTAFYEPAADIEHDVGGTEEGFVSINGAVLIEDVQREAGDNPLHVRLRLRNNTPAPMQAEFMIAFFDWDGNRLISDWDTWRPVRIPAFSRQSVSNYALVTGATKFILYMRVPAPPPVLTQPPGPWVPVPPWAPIR